MTRRFVGALVLAGIAATGACSAASLPPGTPPPEYETRPVEPWPPASATAATTAAPPAEPLEAPPVEPANAPAEVPNDAGAAEPTDAGAPAPATGPL